MNSTLLEIQNPWWKQREAIFEDQHIKAIRDKKYYFSSPLKSQIQFDVGDFHILRGPRQVGKTTLIKEWILKLLIEKKVPPKSIFFLSCEGIDHFKELNDILYEFLPTLERQRQYVFLDEISFLKDWQRGILSCINAGLLSRATLVVTGSNARDLKESSERFPGRRGSGKNINLYPLSPMELKHVECFSHLSDQEILFLYFKIGGFPHAIRDYYSSHTITDETFQTYKNWIIGDASRFGLSEELLKHILFRISETACSRITWPSLIENTPVRSHETALEYVEHLSDSFLCKIHYCYDPDKNGPATQKSRKIFFIDPLLYYLGLTWKNGVSNIWQFIEKKNQTPETLGQLLETSYISNSARFFDPIYFWYSTKTKQEVDLIYDSNDAKIFAEIKMRKERSFKALNQQVDILTHEDFFSFFKQEQCNR